MAKPSSKTKMMTKGQLIDAIMSTNEGFSKKSVKAMLESPDRSAELFQQLLEMFVHVPSLSFPVIAAWCNAKAGYARNRRPRTLIPLR